MPAEIVSLLPASGGPRRTKQRDANVAVDARSVRSAEAHMSGACLRCKACGAVTFCVREWCHLCGGRELVKELP